MGSGLGVVSAELNGLATGMESNPWFSPSVDVVAPDDLQLAKNAAANLNENARRLEQYQKWAEAENRRTAEMLRIAAKAYEDVDKKYADKFDDPGRQAEIDAIAVPVPSTPMPPLPEEPPAMQPLSADDYSDVNQTQQLLSAGDHGASLNVAEVHWGMAATNVEAHAAPQTVTSWEGDAADAARDRMNKLSGWLQNLAAAWQRLSRAAVRVQASHTSALAEHTNIYTRYQFLEARLQQLAAQVSVGNAIETQNEMTRIQKEMEDLQRRSDEVRQEYANNATFDSVQVDHPPFSSSGSSAAPGGGAGGGGGGQPTDDPAATAQNTGQSRRRPQAGAGVASGTGAPSAGGAPSGGGAPPGGSGAPPAGSGPGGGVPGGLPGGSPSTATPRLPADRSLRPAAASGRGGSGTGGGGGGGGGGMPPLPMSPAVTAETVAPGPAVPAAASAAPGPSSGSAAGGMGGMAPIGHGAGGPQGKEKRRDPQLAPDQDLYTEDRPWTEAVIGNRRRRDVQDSRDSSGGNDGRESR
jgi:ESX-1 secreted protein B PE domain